MLGLGDADLHAVENQCLIYSHPSVSAVPLYPRIQPTWDRVVYYSIYYWKKSVYKRTCAVDTRVIQGSTVLEFLSQADPLKTPKQKWKKRL